MRILVLSYEYPPVGGGGGIICKNIAENMSRTGNEVTVLTTAIPEAGKRYLVFGVRCPVSGVRCPVSTSQDLRSVPIFSGRFSAEIRNPDAPSSVRTYVTDAPSSVRTFVTDAPSSVRTFGTKSAIRNLRIIRLPSLRRNTFQSNPLEMLSWIRVTKKFIRNNPGFVDFDICMAHFVLPGGEVALWLKRKFGLPYVLISHGHEIPWVHPRQMFFFHLGAWFWIRKVCTHSEFNFIQTKMMKANIDRFLGLKYSEKNIIIPNGVDTEMFYPDSSKRLYRLRIIFTGRLVIQKDPMTFLKALKIFSHETTDFEVHITGDGHLRQKMERFVRRHGLTSQVIFMGRLEPEKMVEEYQSAHLMVTPSLNEGMSIAALEALSCGVYLIATRASGFEEMIQEGVNGELIRFRDPRNIAEKLVEFYLRNSKEQIISIIPMNHIGELFNWDRISREYQTLFENLLNNRSDR
jgi:glycosyltransferase involved in cell wall biosynthesis